MAVKKCTFTAKNQVKNIFKSQLKNIRPFCIWRGCVNPVQPNEDLLTDLPRLPGKPWENAERKHHGDRPRKILYP